MTDHRTRISDYPILSEEELKKYIEWILYEATPKEVEELLKKEIDKYRNN